MGGKGSGGHRVGAGRKPKSNRERLLDGGADHRGRLLTHPSASPAPAPVEEFDAPNDLTTDERLVWLDLAPHAFKNRTLTRSTSYAFKLLCRNVVIERALAAGADIGGANHRGLIQRVDAELDRFCLRPFGKPVEGAATDPHVQANPLTRFIKKGGRGA